MGGLRGRLAFRWEALQLRLSRKSFGLWLLFNLFGVVFLSALIVFALERAENPGIDSYWDALYMIFITIATVGYGDIVPVTAGGRATIIVTLVLGIGALSGFITLMATRRAEKARRRYSGLEGKISSRDHVVVCGWNNRGKFVIARLKEELEGQYAQIIVLCDLEDPPIEDDHVFFLRGNPVSEADLQRANVADARAAILLADESREGSSGDMDARTVLAALTIRGIDPGVKMTAEVLEPENVHHLELAGVGEILDTNEFIGNLIARSAISYGLINAVSDLVTMGAGMRLFALPASGDMLGKTRREVAERLRREHGARLLSIAAESGLETGDEGYRLMEGDYLLVMAEKRPAGSVSGRDTADGGRPGDGRE